MRHRIGLVYLPGALPCFEAFGNLPTDIVREDGRVAGKPASDVLDMIIIPGGSLVESRTVNDKVAQEILKIADAGKFVLGICAGFQILARGTDIGRLSATPIVREGLGLLDVDFKPLICTDQVKATVVGASCLTSEIGAEVTGFHCHTYGEVELHEKAKTILVSHVKRLNYFKNPRDLVSGISNADGNVVGVTLHALLDQNPLIIQGITKSLNINPTELREVRAANAKLQKEISSEVGISTKIYAENKPAQKTKPTRMLLMTALESGSGKTFIVTGLAGVLKKMGCKVGVIKIGGDIRDSVPALYLIKEPIRDYSSILICGTGWKPLSEAVTEASKDYDFLIIEGAMNVFTGLLNNQMERPTSTAEVAAALGVPTVLVAGCDKEGIEGGLVSALNYVHILKSLGIQNVGVILNKVYTSYLTDEIKLVMKKAFAASGVELLGIVPRVNLEGRGTIPEIEIKYEEFGAKAIEVAEKSLDIDKITKIAQPPTLTQIDYEEFLQKFTKLLLTEPKLTDA